MPTAISERLANFVEKWRHPTGLRKLGAILAIGLMIASTTLMVYHTGGTKNVYAHLMYAAVLVAAFYFNIAGGLIAGIIAGLALGPSMPLDVAAGIAQSPANWLFRLGFFSMTGIIAGLGFKVLNYQLDWLLYYAYHDDLTGLPNLAAMRKHIQQLENQHHSQTPPNIGVISFSLINLAEIVSSLGYKKTEQLIQKLARRLKFTFSYASMLARVDSDKFAAVVIHKDADSKGEDPLAPFRELRSLNMTIDDVPIHIEASIGLANLSSSRWELDALIPMAEIAARNAYTKNLGVAVYDAEQDSKNRENLRLLSELGRGVGQNQLLLYYQPKLHLASNRIFGAEALIRWQHPNEGLISPERFIFLAERTALIKPITRQVLHLALRQFSEWQRNHLDLEVAINLSTHNLLEPDLIRWIIKLINTYQVPQEKLTLEITESALMYPTSDTVRNLTKLRHRGINIAIDDFGTGYSSLAYLRQLPVSSLKIDQSFLCNLKDERDKAIVQTAVDFGHHLNLLVVAEGVESEETLEFLKSIGCDVAQGNLISPPVSAEELLQKLQYPPETHVPTLLPV